MKRNRYFAVTLLAVTFVIFLEISGCKQEPESSEKGSVSIEDIKIGYPDIESQKQRMDGFLGIVEQGKRLGNPDETLRCMVEEVPLNYIAGRLEVMSQEASADSKPNIAILLERIREIRSLRGDKASVFIKKLKEEKDVNALCISLSGLRTEAAQAKAADALASIGDSKAAKVLTIQLVGASGMAMGGAEGRILREQLRRSLVGALASCTGLYFSDYDPSNESASLKVVKQCEDWLEKHGR